MYWAHYTKKSQAKEGGKSRNWALGTGTKRFGGADVVSLSLGHTYVWIFEWGVGNVRELNLLERRWNEFTLVYG